MAIGVVERSVSYLISIYFKIYLSIIYYGITTTSYAPWCLTVLKIAMESWKANFSFILKFIMNHILRHYHEVIGTMVFDTNEGIEIQLQLYFKIYHRSYTTALPRGDIGTVVSYTNEGIEIQLQLNFKIYHGSYTTALPRGDGHYGV